LSGLKVNAVFDLVALTLLRVVFKFPHSSVTPEELSP
jgi:hypothetical protein